MAHIKCENNYEHKKMKSVRQIISENNDQTKQILHDKLVNSQKSYTMTSVQNNN